MSRIKTLTNSSTYWKDMNFSYQEDSSYYQGTTTSITILQVYLASWSEMTLNYQVMVEGYPNLKEEVGGSNPGCEISSLLDGKLARW